MKIKTTEKFDTSAAPPVLSSGTSGSLFLTTDTNGNISSIDMKGIIVAWNGTLDKIPQGWAVCDGTKDTPNLSGRFIIGAGAGNNLTARTPNETGGTESHVLTINELPSHTHQYNKNTGICNQDCKSGNNSWFMINPSNTGITDAVGSPTPAAHNNMPPYYVLFYIMKL